MIRILMNKQRELDQKLMENHSNREAILQELKELENTIKYFKNSQPIRTKH